MAHRRYNVLTSSDYGTMIVNRFDAAVSFNLSINGSWDRVAVGVLQELVRGLTASRKGDLVAVDVGANLGALAVPLGRALEGRGVVHAFEPQRLIYYMLCGNVAIASTAGEASTGTAWPSGHATVAVAAGSWSCGCIRSALPGR